MKTTFFIVFDRTGAQRMTKKHAPSLYRSELAVRFSVTISDNAFRQPIIKAQFEVPEDKVMLPEIEADVADPVEGK